MLEVGGGIGAIEIELLKAGVTSAVNVELTPTYEEAAGELLRETGLADRVERRVLDFVETGADVEAADFVVLNRVICCYPDMPRLTAAAAKRVRHTLVLTFPNSRWWTRLGLTIVNFGFRVVRVQFRVFLHRPELIQAAAEQYGLKTTLNDQGLLWQVMALDKAAQRKPSRPSRRSGLHNLGIWPPEVALTSNRGIFARKSPRFRSRTPPGQ